MDKKVFWGEVGGVLVNNGILFNHNNEKNMPCAIAWMDLEGTVLSKINQKEKHQYCMSSLIGGTCKTNEKSQNS